MNLPLAVPSNLIKIKGDLIDSDCQYIAHQCNCVTTYGKGLSKTIFDRYPYANIYGPRVFNGQDRPGEIIIKGSKDQRRVINMLAQIYPGLPKYYNDSAKARLVHFQRCLDQIGQIEGLTSVGFPEMIGCGLAGGNHQQYLAKLIEFASVHPNVRVCLYSL